jgi:hypothetical protein
MFPSVCKVLLIALCIEMSMFSSQAYANDGALDDIVSVSDTTVPVRIDRVVNGLNPPVSQFAPQGIDVYRSMLNDGARLVVAVPLLTGPQSNLPFWGSTLKLLESTSLGTLVHRTRTQALLYEQLTLIQSSTVNRRVLTDSENATVNQSYLRIIDSTLQNSAELSALNSHIGVNMALTAVDSQIAGSLIHRTVGGVVGGGNSFYPTSYLDVSNSSVGGDILHTLASVSSPSPNLQIVTKVDTTPGVGAPLDHVIIGVGGQTNAFALSADTGVLQVGELEVVYVSDLSPFAITLMGGTQEVVQWVASDVVSDLQLVNLGATTMVDKLTLYVDGDAAQLMNAFGSIQASSVSVTGTPSAEIGALIAAMIL